MERESQLLREEYLSCQETQKNYLMDGITRDKRNEIEKGTTE